MSGQLRAVTLLNAVTAAGNYPSAAGYPLDYRFTEETQTRTVFVSSVTTDTIQVQTSIDGTNWFNQSTALSTPGVVTVTGPWAFLRVVKTGAANPATVTAII